MKDLSGNPDNQLWEEHWEELRAENEVLKLKLELEFGMNSKTFSTLTPPDENQWLKNIYAFEQQFREGKRIKVVDRLGNPSIRKIENLREEEVDVELQGLLLMMEEKGVALDVCAQYDKSLIYKFIVEELFDQEIDDISLGGYVHHFIYEEFHPNHDHDIRQYTHEFVELLMSEKLSEFDSRHFAQHVSLRDVNYEQTVILDLIKAFQGWNRVCVVKELEINLVNIDVESWTANVVGRVRFASGGIEKKLHTGEFALSFVHELGYWYINGCEFPGLGV